MNKCVKRENAGMLFDRYFHEVEKMHKAGECDIRMLQLVLDMKQAFFELPTEDIMLVAGCKYCAEYEDLPEHIINGEPVGKIFDTCIQPDEKGLWHIELPSGLDIGIKFCPYCGRELKEI